ncbi:MAG: TetR family transcriptional regulator [Acidimicrobiia bacterium]|nr:TetR family transcriptional regulator [Acidimicrobiia bacterium]MDH3397582.1 TetR family transcriptional regulator [Acidimicrobiia bacterium]
MRSTEAIPADGGLTDDRTAKARIRDAAVVWFAEHGVAATTVRKVASAAGVSPGLVMHHFRSMEGLRSACDEYVVARIRDLKSDAMAAGTGFDPLAALRSSTAGPPIARYLARTLVDGSPYVDDLVDEIVADAVEYTQAGVETGLLIPGKYPQQRAAILTIWSLGALVLHEHLERLIGVDITGPLDDQRSASAYLAPLLEIFSGFFTETTVKLMNEAFVDVPAEEEGAL